MPGDVEQHHLLDELFGAQPVTFVLGGDQRAEEVVVRVRSLPVEGLVDIGDDVVDRIERGELLVTGEDRVERLHDGTRPLPQLRAVATLGDPEHLGDHDERQRERQVGDEVHLAGPARVDRIEVLVDELLHPGLELLDGPRREHLRHEPAEAVVVGRVEVEHRVRATLAAFVEHRLDVGVHRDGQRLRVALLDAQARVPEHPVHVLVSKQRPHAERAQVHGILLAHQRILLVRVVEEPRFERVEHRREVAGIGRFARGHGLHATPAWSRARA